MRLVEFERMISVVVLVVVVVVVGETVTTYKQVYNNK